MQEIVLNFSEIIAYALQQEHNKSITISPTTTDLAQEIANMHISDNKTEDNTYTSEAATAPVTFSLNTDDHFERVQECQQTAHTTTKKYEIRVLSEGQYNMRRTEIEKLKAMSEPVCIVLNVIGLLISCLVNLVCWISWLISWLVG